MPPAQVRPGEPAIALRPARPDDVDFIVELANDPDVTPFIGVRAPRDRDTLLAELRRAGHEAGWFVIEHGGCPAGAVAFTTVNPRSRIAELHRLMVHPDARGHGVGAEAARRFGVHLIRELGFHRVEAQCYGYNTRSIRTFDRAGFSREGVKRSAYLRDGTWHDAVCFGLVEEDL